MSTSIQEDSLVVCPVHHLFPQLLLQCVALALSLVDDIENFETYPW